MSGMGGQGGGGTGRLLEATLHFMKSKGWPALADEIRERVRADVPAVETDLALGAAQQGLESEEIQLVRATLLQWVAEGRPNTWQIGSTRDPILKALIADVQKQDGRIRLSSYLAEQNNSARHQKEEQRAHHSSTSAQTSSSSSSASTTQPSFPPPPVQMRTQPTAPQMPASSSASTARSAFPPPSLQHFAPTPVPMRGQHLPPQMSSSSTATSQPSFPPPPVQARTQPTAPQTSASSSTSSSPQAIRRRRSSGPPPLTHGQDLSRPIAEKLLQEHKDIVVMDAEAFSGSSKAKELAKRKEYSPHFQMFTQSLNQIVKKGDDRGWYSLGATCLTIKMGNCQNLMAAMFKLLKDHEDWHFPIELVALVVGTAGHHFIIVNRPNAATKEITQTQPHEWGDAFVIDLWRQNLHAGDWNVSGLIECADYQWLHDVVGKLRQDLYWPGK